MSNRGSFGAYDGGYSSYHSGGPPSGQGGRDSSNEFTRLTQVIANNIQKINSNVSQMQKHIGLIGTPQDNPELRDKLHQVTHYSNQLAKETSKYLKDLSHLPLPPTQSEQRQWKMQKERLMNEFTAALNNFQTSQRKVAEKEKDSVKRARANSGLNYDPFRDEKKPEPLVGIDSPPQQSVQMEQDVDLQLIQEREQAILQLESDITDVNTIFKDLGMLVHEQGEVIDSIESNVENAAVHVEQGTEQLSRARDYQSKARRKKCIIIIILLVVLGIIATIIGVTVSKN